MNKNKFLFFLPLLFLCLSQLSAENCAECPRNDDDQQHRQLLKWAGFHCDQIRELKNQVQELKKSMLSEITRLEKDVQSHKKRIVELEEWR